MAVNIPDNYDFSGWATRNNVLCADGRTIRQNAFKHQNGKTVPLVWQHRHDSISNILGHAILENRDEGVYAYCYLNDSEEGNKARKRVQHGDLDSLSIFANDLVEKGKNVMHGVIRELSLVISGANPEAFIDNVVVHSADGLDEEVLEDSVYIYSGEQFIMHDNMDEDIDEFEEEDYDEDLDELEEFDDADDTEEDLTLDEIDELIDELDEDELEELNDYLDSLDSLDDDDEDEEDDDFDGEVEHSGIDEGDSMSHNVFDRTMDNEDVISHAEQLDILNEAKSNGSLRNAVLQHGITDVDWLFPEARNLNTPPDWIRRDTGWVSVVLGGVHHTPFSRIKSMFADLREDEARAKGYIKGNLKKEEVFSLLRRTTTPQTIYKKQKMDRDDIIDITDFDVVSWLKQEMRFMLDEEIARAILIGDGRLTSSDDKIKEDNVRPISTDADLYTIKTSVTVTSGMTDDQKARAFIRAAVKARKDYKGSGNPILFTTEDNLINMRLIEDLNQRIIYESDEKLASALRVSRIVTVPVMEDAKDASGNAITGIILNLNDYNVGADKGGAINMFEDFDIDYNKETYLIETRISGALIKPYSAIVITEATS